MMVWGYTRDFGGTCVLDVFGCFFGAFGAFGHLVSGDSLILLVIKPTNPKNTSLYGF